MRSGEGLQPGRHTSPEMSAKALVSSAIKGDSSQPDLQAVMIKRVHKCENQAGGWTPNRGVLRTCCLH